MAFAMTRAEYRRYLRSADFDKRIRQPALKRAGGVCEDCGKPGRLQVHHLDYFCVGTAEELANVRVVCGRCHLRTVPGGGRASVSMSMSGRARQA